MKIGLISPRASFVEANKYLREFWSSTPPPRSYQESIGLGLLVVGALTPEKHEVELVDENVDEIDFAQKYDLVGVSCLTTQQATRAYAVADEFRKRRRKVVIGGVHPTLLPEEAKAHADSVVVGEAEYLWGKVLHDCENHRLQDFYKCEEPVDMKDSPVPRFDLVDPKKYTAVAIQTSRGCPHDCEFCTTPKLFGRKYKEKSTEQILREIEYVKSLFGSVRYWFFDDNFFVNKNQRRQLLQQLAGLNIVWGAITDISIAEDDDLLSLARRSGCRTLFIGFESLKGGNLWHIEKWKHSYLNKYSEYIRRIQSHGIGVHGAFIVGFDEDDASTFDTIVEFVLENNLYGADISLARRSRSQE
jgi:radical SAM superfamily enzyme YgiQ (UPF0313 family)